MIFKKSVRAVALATTLGLGTMSVGVQAQDAVSSSDSQQTNTNRSDDMAARVKQALHSDPGLYDKHIDVSMEKGKVVMSGFVNSAGDMQKAVRAASKTAGKNMVNKLTIKRSDDANSDNAGG